MRQEQAWPRHRIKQALKLLVIATTLSAHLLKFAWGEERSIMTGGIGHTDGYIHYWGF